MMNHSKINDKLKDDSSHLPLKEGYICLMDCEHGKIYPKQESCPVCKMDLVKTDNN